MSSGGCSRALRIALLHVSAAGAACGGFVTSDGNVARRTVDSRGGEMAFGAFSISVPPGGLSHTATLSVRRSPIDAPASAAYSVEPSGVTFNAASPAEVVIRYDPLTFSHPAEIFVAVFDGAEWHPLTKPDGADLDAGRAHGLAIETGTFGLISCPDAICPTPNVDGSATH